jgi:hypothetical protein
MKKIEAVKQGNVVNFSINGKLQKKNCGSPEEATTLYKALLKAKETDSDEDFKAFRCLLSEKLRIAYLAGLETDVDTQEVYLAGFNTPVPMTLVQVFKEYAENNYPLEAITNFWKLLMINPDKRVRNSLFDFITTHDFVLTSKGYMLVYKKVERIDVAKNDFAEFVSNKFLHVKKTWKESPKNYVVYKDKDEAYGITKIETATKWSEKEIDKVEVLGNLNDLFDSIFNTDDPQSEVPVYTDLYTHTMHIELGKPVRMERKECDSDPMVECSYGLHCGATKSRTCNCNT